MDKLFTYFNNKIVPQKKIFEIQCPDVLAADEALKKETGFDAFKCPWIGCTVKNLSKENV